MCGTPRHPKPEPYESWNTGPPPPPPPPPLPQEAPEPKRSARPKPNENGPDGSRKKNRSLTIKRKGTAQLGAPMATIKGRSGLGVPSA